MEGEERAKLVGANAVDGEKSTSQKYLTRYIRMAAKAPGEGSAVQVDDPHPEETKTNVLQCIWVARGSVLADEDIDDWCALTGQEREATRDWGWLDMVHPDDRERVRQAWVYALEHNTPLRCEHRIRRYDGVYRTFSVMSRPLFNWDGSIKEWIGTSTDITDFRRQEEEAWESKWFYRMIFEHASAGIVCLNLNGLLMQMNQKFCSIMGRERDDLLGLPIEGVLCGGEEIQEFLLKARRGGEELDTFECRYTTPENNILWIKLTSALMCSPSGKVHYIVLLVEDISNDKFAQEERGTLLAQEQAARIHAETAARRLQALQAVTDTAFAYLSSEELLTKLLERVMNILQADSAAIFLLSSDDQYLIAHTLLGKDEVEHEIGFRIPIGRGAAGLVAKSRRPLIIEDLSTVESLRPILRKHSKSWLGVPLITEGRLIGVVDFATHTPRKFSDDDRELVQRVGDRLVLTLEQMRLREAGEREKAKALEKAQRLEAVFNSMTDSVFVHDREGKIIQYNTTAYQMWVRNCCTGNVMLPMEECLAYPMTYEEYGKVLREEERPVNRILNGETIDGQHTVDVWLHLPENRRLLVSISGAPLFDQYGKNIGAVSIFRDVTETRRVEKRVLKAFDALLGMAETLVQKVDETRGKEHKEETHLHRIRTIGKRLAELTQHVLNSESVAIALTRLDAGVFTPVVMVGPSQEVIDEWWEHAPMVRIDEFFSEEQIAKLKANEIVMTEARLLPSEHRIRQHPHYFLVAPMFIDERLVGIFTLEKKKLGETYSKDEVGLVKAIAKLAALAVERERLQSEWTQAHANELALKEANRRFDEFLSIASHELRTPLTTIKGNVQLASKRLGGLKWEELKESAPEFQQKLERARKPLIYAEHRANVQNRMIGDMLDVSRIQTGKLELRRKICDLADIVREAVEDQRYGDSHREIILNMPQRKIEVFVDVDRIGQVVNNYLTNALKYSPEDKPVDVGVEVEGKMVTVAVHDEGVGISEEDQGHIWERFYRAKNVEVQHGADVSLGLGLHISATIIENHHGQVGLQSERGKGSTFWFTLPLARPGKRRAGDYD